MNQFMNRRLIIIFLLGFSSGLPLALLTTTLQAWFSEKNLSIFTVGLLSLIGLPYLYRIFWSPLTDRFSLFSMGKRRSWIFTTQLGLTVGFFIMGWITPSHPLHLGVFALILACLSATQDTVIDAHRIEYLPENEHGIGASIGVLGYRVALLVSGGLALVIAENFGWVLTYRIMGLLMALMTITVLVTKEPAGSATNTNSLLFSFVEPLKELWRRPYIIAYLFFIFFYKLGEAFTSTTSGIVMPFLIQGLGFSLQTIGYVNKILGISAILIGGLTAGFLLMRWTMYRSLLIFGLIQAATNLTFIALAIVGKNCWLLAVAVACDNFAAGMGSTALVALFMKSVNRNYTATQLCLLVAVASIPRVLSGPFAAFLQYYLGWTGMYEVAFLIALCFIPFLKKIKTII